MSELRTAWLRGDSFSIAPTWLSESFDLVLTDPPYGIEYKSNRRTVNPQFPQMAGDDNLDWLPEFVNESYRLLKPDRHFYCFCRWSVYHKFYLAISEKFNIKNVIIWVKDNQGCGDLKGSYAPKYEMVIFAQKGRRELQEKRYPDVFQYPTVPTKLTLHPTQKPVDMLRLFIRNSTLPGETVWDPFGGVASVPVAAKMEHRGYVAVEINKGYYGKGTARLNPDPLPLFKSD